MIILFVHFTPVIMEGFFQPECNVARRFSGISGEISGNHLELLLFSGI